MEMRLGIHRRSRLSALMPLALLLLGACSSSSSSGGGSADCASTCQRTAALKCPNDPPEAECESKCQQSASFPACQSQANAANSCLATAPIQCGADGKSTTSSCSSEATGLAVCLFTALLTGD